MLKLDKVKKYFTDVKAVDGIDLEIQDGCILGILGPNGAGKTTTIRMIMNIIQPDSGSILMDGIDSIHFDHSQIGYLPEERGVYQKAKVVDVIRYFAALRSLSASMITEQTEKWLKKLKIEDLADMKASELSKGNQQKVQFILAVIHEPDILILDEPFTGLDPMNQKILHQIIQDFKSQGKTIILSTHQMAKVEELCDSIAFINKGQIIKTGATKDVMKEFNNSLDQAFITLVGGDNE